MSGIHDQDRIDALRRRLYARGEATEERSNHELTDDPQDVNKTWEHPPAQKPMDIRPPSSSEVAQSVAAEPVTDTAPASPEATVVTEDSEPEIMSPKKRKRKYRLKLILVGIFFFVGAVAISSVLMVVSNKTISGDNIAVNIDGPFTIGGGEVLPLQIGVTNSNNVPIKSATLIVEYPLGTKSTQEEGKELFIERLPLDIIDTGETLNIPLRAVVFGEENDERAVKVSIEYRVEGSNALFFKEAEDLRFKISSSPVVLTVASVKRISSGQETDIELSVRSNSPNPVSDVLVTAEYPFGFDYTTSNPDTVSGNNVWRIDELGPEEEKTILIKGILIGKETDEKAMHFSVGIPSERDPFSLASVFTTGSTQFEIEQPFLDINVDIGQSANEAIVEPGQATGVVVNFENTLGDTLYDAEVVVELSGNALSDLEIGPPSGFYDSNTDTITWDQTTHSGLDEILPGAKERLTFTLVASEEVDRTPQIDIVVNVKARRVNEVDVPEQLLGVADAEIKVLTVPQVISEAAYAVADTGPVPPTVGETTTYTLSLLVQNGTNEISGGEVTASLPSYVTWLDDVSGPVSYNPSTRVVTWLPGEVPAGSSKQASFRVSFLPSATQIDTTPTLLSEQRLKATDNFTGSVIRANRAAVTTELSSEAGFERGSGRVIE